MFHWVTHDKFLYSHPSFLKCVYDNFKVIINEFMPKVGTLPSMLVIDREKFSKMNVDVISFERLDILQMVPQLVI